MTCKRSCQVRSHTAPRDSSPSWKKSIKAEGSFGNRFSFMKPTTVAKFFAGRMHYAWVVLVVMFFAMLAGVGVRPGRGQVGGQGKPRRAPVPFCNRLRQFIGRHS